MLLGAFSGLDLGKKSILYIAVLKTKTNKATETVFYFCVVLYGCSSKEKKQIPLEPGDIHLGGKARILAF